MSRAIVWIVIVATVLLIAALIAVGLTERW